MAAKPTVLSTLQKLHAQMHAAFGTEPLPREDFDKAMILTLGVGYPQVYNLLKTGESVGLWRQGRQGQRKVVVLLSQPNYPTAHLGQPEAPPLLG